MNPVRAKSRITRGVLPLTASLLLLAAALPASCGGSSGESTVYNYRMSDVSIVQEPTFSMVDDWLTADGAYRIYQVDVTLDLLNGGSEDNFGFITLHLTDAASGTALEFPTNSPMISVLAGEEKVTTVTAYFCIEITGPPPQSFGITAEVSTEFGKYTPTELNPTGFTFN